MHRLRTIATLGGVAFECELAATPAQQSLGLQEHRELGRAEGMLFPFAPPHSVTFHMGRVTFPIDIVFVDSASRVARIVHRAAPGVTTKWTWPRVAAVVELAGGACVEYGIGVSALVELPSWTRSAAHTCNLLRTIVEADAPTHTDMVPYETVAVPPRAKHLKDTPVVRDRNRFRFKDRQMPADYFDEALRGEGDDGGRGPELLESGGYSQMDTDNFAGDGPFTRQSKKTKSESAAEQIAEAGERAYQKMLDAAESWPWRHDALGVTESVVLTPAMVEYFAEDHTLTTLLLADDAGALGDSFVNDGLAQLTRWAPGVGLCLFRPARIREETNG